ncbi:MAG TPA: hypothetical protein VFX02_03130 [Gammaproteobacteria bacterium]|nr:hypothetical protein [Gammaproteobacteria bacterium]
MKKLLQSALLLLAASGSDWAGADRFDDEINNYISIFQTGTSEQQIQACQQLEGTGLSDHRLFDVIAANLVEKGAAISSDTVELLAWHAKALGFSGEDKYRETLQKPISGKQYRMLTEYTKEGIALLQRHILWNPIISDRTNFKESESLAANRIANMLGSDDLDLRVLAVKTIRLGNHGGDPYILDRLVEAMLKSYKNISGGKIKSNVQSMAEIVASSKDPRYLPPLMEVSTGTNHADLGAWVKIFIQRNYGKRAIFSPNVGVSSLAADASLEERKQAELRSYKDAFRKDGAPRVQKNVCNALQWSGISDVELYDLIEQRLNEILDKFAHGSRSSEDLETAAWYAKGLAASGMDKYLPVLRRMAGSRHQKLANYAEDSIPRIESYKKWNPIISDEKNFRSDQPLLINRIANMLRSDDSRLKLVGLKKLREDSMDSEYLFDIIRDDLMAGYKKAHADRADVAVFELEVGILGDSGNRKYYDSLKQVYSETKSREKLRSISQALRNLD